MTTHVSRTDQTKTDKPDQPDKWAAKITAAWQKCVASIFDVGDMLIKAQADLGPRFDAMVQDLPFGRRTAERLIRIAEASHLRTHMDLLPASWGTLYELAKMDAAHFEQAVQRAQIHPDLERVEAVMIKQQYERADSECVHTSADAEHETNAGFTSDIEAAPLVQTTERGDVRHAQVDIQSAVDTKITKLARNVASQVKSGLTELVGAQTAKEKADAVKEVVLSAMPAQ